MVRKLPTKRSCHHRSNTQGNWFDTIFTDDLINSVRDRGAYNINETSLSFQIKQRVAKLRGTRRPPSIPFVILGGLAKVPKDLSNKIDQPFCGQYLRLKK
ncbi:MAG: hypothetical protein EZS28_033377 [Streblomastix strix]|uniref:Uncharacterized protein n=1 Tax=Streblomastix strix TaxID=222440 RepID=A0A5J4UKA9_9EUKA|nr:MAG: hypothetical protein EZS28_033377 [Streblomastix strix]